MTDSEERAAIIEYAENADPDFRSGIDGPGRFEGSSDRELAAALHMVTLHGVHDEEIGSVEEVGAWYARIDRWVLVVDSQGFIDFEDHASIDGAIARMQELADALYPDTEE